MTQADVPPTRAQRFAALAEPAARRAGYSGRGAVTRLSRDTNIPDSTISRMLMGKTVPDPKFFEPLAKALNLPLRDLFVAAGIISESALTQNEPSDVRSIPISVADAATRLGIKSHVGRELFESMVERLKRGEHAPNADDHNGGAAAAH